MSNPMRDQAGATSNFAAAFFLALWLLALYLYLPILNNYFIADDFIAIQESLPKPDLKVYDLLLEPGGWFWRPITRHWFPITNLFYGLDYALYGLNPVGFHLTNVFFHWLNALAIYYLSLRLTGKRPVATLAAFLFLIHPIHNEAVAWSAARFHTLGAFFYLMAVIFFIRYIEGQPKSLVNYGLSIFFYGVGLLTLESAVTVPVVLLMYYLLYKRKEWQERTLRAKLRLWAPYLAVFLAFVGLRSYLTGASDYQNAINMVQALKNMVRFLAGLGIPSIPLLKVLGIFEGYPPPEIVPAQPYYWAAAFSALIITLLGALALSKGYGQAILRNKSFAFAIWWVVVTPAPFYFLFFRERYAELPSVGFCFLLALLIFALIENPAKKVRYYLTLFLVPALILNYYFLTRAKLAVWRQAGEITQGIMQQVQKDYPSLPEGSTIFFINLPGYIQPLRVPTFNVGMPNALRLLYRTNQLVGRTVTSESELRTVASSEELVNFYVFSYSQGRLVNLTHRFP